MPNGLVPQAPAHTDSLTVYETHLQEMKLLSDGDGEGRQGIRRAVVVATGVVEQRVSHFLMGLALIGTMTGPLLRVLQTMPTAIFAGVFFVVGVSKDTRELELVLQAGTWLTICFLQWGSIESNGIVKKLLFLQREERFIQRDEPLLLVRRRKTVLFLALQLVIVASCVAVSNTVAAVGFPVLIMLSMPLRIIAMPHWFTLRELRILDDFTATGEVVLASLGGRPRLREERKAGAVTWE